MKICYIAPYPPQRGGVEGQVSSVVSRLRESHEIHIITYGGCGRDEGGVEFHEIPVCDTFFFRGAQFVRGAVKVLKEIGGGMDLIHAHPLHPGGTAAVISRRYHDTPIVATSHGSDLLNFSKKFPSCLFRWVGNRLDTLICVSRFLEDRAREIGIKTDIEVLGNGLDFGKIEEVEELGIQDTIVFAGSLKPYKNPREVINVAEEHPKYSFKIIGGGPLKRELQLKIKGLDLDNVEMMGSLPREDTLPWIRSASCVLIPSDYEGFGLSAVEAMALETPVLAHDVPALNEILCKESLTDNMSESLTRLKDHEFKRAMVEKNYERARELKIENKVERLEKIYKKLGKA